MEGFIGEVRMFAGNFAPRSWGFCEGQLLAISQNSALFSILGTTYGGDGRTTFGLPDLRGRTPIGAGNGPGLSDHRLGAKGGREGVRLTTIELPTHDHTSTLKFNSTPNTDNPSNAYLSGVDATDATGLSFNNSPDGFYNPAAFAALNAGGGQETHLMQPYIPIYYIIAMFGTYPSRS